MKLISDDFGKDSGDIRKGQKVASISDNWKNSLVGEDKLVYLIVIPIIVVIAVALSLVFGKNWREIIRNNLGDESLVLSTNPFGPFSLYITIPPY